MNATLKYTYIYFCVVLVVNIAVSTSRDIYICTYTDIGGQGDMKLTYGTIAVRKKDSREGEDKVRKQILK